MAWQTCMHQHQQYTPYVLVRTHARTHTHTHTHTFCVHIASVVYQFCQPSSAPSDPDVHLPLYAQCTHADAAQDELTGGHVIKLGQHAPTRDHHHCTCVV